MTMPALFIEINAIEKIEDEEGKVNYITKDKIIQLSQIKSIEEIVQKDRGSCIITLLDGTVIYSSTYYSWIFKTLRNYNVLLD